MRQKKTLSPEKIRSDNEMSKIKINLRRFEEERRRFELEREKFEKEKREIERIRCRRLEEFERKRLLRQFQEAPRIELIGNESVTFLSSEDQGFDQPDVAFRPTVIQRKPSNGSLLGRYIENGDHQVGLRNGDTPHESSQTNDGTPAKKQSLLSRIFFGKRNAAPRANKTTIVEEFKYLPDDKPITFWYFMAEARFIWRQLLRDHPVECRLTAQIRNRCIIEFIIMSIYLGAGGLIFRFVEGAFENFYKCGVRRVKRDFVDNLWHSSHNLRFFVIV